MRFLYLLTSFIFLTISVNAQCPAGSVASNVNIVVNGDFETGINDFSSNYGACNTSGCLYSEGFYAVGADPSFYHPNFDGVDHTTGTGNFMIVNGSYTANVSIWCQTVTVMPNTLYLFSTWVTSVTSTNVAELQFSINGVPLGSTFNAPNYTLFGTQWPGWVEYNTSWYSGSATTADICIVNQNTATGGNDFGLDDISFQACNCTFQTPPVSNAIICGGSPTTLTAGAGADTYLWSPSTDVSCSTCQSTIVTPATNTTYTLIASLNYCLDTVTAEVTLAPTPTADAGNDTSICSNNPLQLEASGGTIYSWSPSNGLSSSTSSSPLASVSQSTTYIVTVTNSGGCSDSDSIIITILNPGNVTAGADTSVCFGATINLHASGAASYTWLPSSGVACSTCENTTATPTANSTYTVIASTNTCFDTIAVDVTVWQLPSANAGNDATTCADEPITLQGSGGINYEWTPATGLNSSTSSTPIATLQQTTTYTLVVTDANGCMDQDNVIVNVNPLPVASISTPVTNACPGNTITLTASGGISYAWSPVTNLNTSTGNIAIATVNNNQMYTVNVTDANGCTDDAQISLQVFIPGIIYTSPDTFICYGAPLTLTANGGLTYNWNGTNANCNNCNTLEIPFSKTSGTYNITAIDLNGCPALADVEVLINMDCEQLEFPTAFTPNNDGLNDYFHPISKSISSIEYFVYNRWGQLMFSGNSMDKGWDGLFNNAEQPVGAYSWYAKATTVTGRTKNLQGNVTLLR